MVNPLTQAPGKTLHFIEIVFKRETSESQQKTDVHKNTSQLC